MNENAERDAFSRLITSAKMLLQNAVGCAVNHYGEDYSTHGEPGWIADCRADIVRAADVMQSRAALTPPPVQGEVTCAMVDAAMSSWFGVTYDGRGARKEMAAAIAAALAQAEGHSAPEGVNAVEATKGAEANLAMLMRAFNTSGCTVFLDGRNEHGSHVIMSYPSNLPADAQCDVDEYAEEILLAAEALGFNVGEDHVWTEWRWNKPQIGFEGRVELSGYWEFVRIDEELTRAALNIPDLSKQGEG